MKKLTFLVLIICFTVNVFAQTAFTLSGKLTGEPNAPIILKYINSEGQTITDSALIKNGSFTFKGDINGGILANLLVSRRSSKEKIGAEWNSVQFFLDPANITASGNFENLKDLKFIGSKTNKEFEPLRDQLAIYNETSKLLQERYDTLNMQYARINRIDEDDKRLKIIGKTLDSLRDAMSEPYFNMVRQFISTHYDSYVSVYELNTYKSHWRYKQVKGIYDKLSPPILNGYYGMQLKNFVDGIENNSNGKVAKNFTSVDLNGKTISLSDFKGKYVLLDFWGSWCVPCRAAVPHIKDLFSKYHNSGLDIIAIAVDDKPTEWNKAIEKDGTNIWYNIMQPSRRNEHVDKAALIDDAYNVHVYPTKILVGKDGVIIGRYEGTESTAALDKKLAELFKGRD